MKPIRSNNPSTTTAYSLSSSVRKQQSPPEDELNKSSWLDGSSAEKLPTASTLDSLQSGSVLTQNYFGDLARLKFFERYRQLKNQSKLTLTSRREPLNKIYFEKERPFVASVSVPSQLLLENPSKSSVNVHGPLMAGDADMVENDETKGDSFFLTAGGTESIAFEDTEANPKASTAPIDDLDDQQFVKDDFDEEDSVFDQIEGRKGSFQKAFTDSSLIIPSLELNPYEKRRPMSRRPLTAPHRNDSPTSIFRTNPEKHSAKVRPPKPISASSGRKIYKFQPDPPPKKSSLPLSARLSQSTSSLVPQQSLVSTSLTARVQSAVPVLSKQSSRFTFVRRKSVAGGLQKKKSSKKQKSVSININPPTDTDHQNDNQSLATGTTSNSSDWLFTNEHLNTSEDYTELTITSPRTKFLVNCINEDMNPRASLVLRRNLTKRLELQHQGMGDKMAISLAHSIRDLPFVESLNIADNMLTDAGLGPIILAAAAMPSLTELNLSQNIIGTIASKALHDYLMEENCTLKILVLNNADVDDFECSGFIEAVKENKSLREVDLSRNLIGKSENLNTVKGDVITGSEAIADLLRSSECNLTKLHLQWNMIRLDGAIDLASSIAINQTLTYLDLSFNSLSTDGGMVLGVSLLKNQVLRTLILSNNSIDAKACVTICAGIIENHSLQKVVMDDNPIGVQGMKALMMVPILAGNRVKISASKCNVTIKDPKCWFDFDRVVRDYRLDLEDGYERAIAIFLLHVIAGHQTYSFAKFAIEAKMKRPKSSGTKPPPSKGSATANNNTTSNSGSGGKLKSLDLVQVLIKEDEKTFDAKQIKVLKELQKVCISAADLHKAGELFHEFDFNGNGCLEEDELLSLLTAIGLDISERRLKELIEKFDADGDQCIEIFEFVMLLRSLHLEAYSRIQEMRYSPRMVLASSVSQYPLHESVYVPHSVIPYLPPEQGYLHISITDDLIHKHHYRILTSSQKEYILEVVKTAGSSNLIIPMITAAVEHIKLRLEEALNIADIMLTESHDKVEIVRNLLFQIDSSNDANHFIHSLFGSNRTQMARLKREFGMLLRCILGNPTGYYILDLSKPSHRKCLNKLSTISSSQATARKARMAKLLPGRNLGDLSQKGNYSLFRNEMLNGHPITITAAFCSPIPTAGKVEFDFTCHLTASLEEDLPMSDERVIRLLVRYFILEPKDVAVALQKLFDWKVRSELQLACNGMFSGPNEICSLERMKAISLHMDEFYQNVSLRLHAFEESLEKMSRPVIEGSHGRMLEIFEKDKFIPNWTIEQGYRSLEDLLALEEEARVAKAAGRRKRGKTILIPDQIKALKATSRKLSTMAGKGLRQRRRSLVMAINASNDDEDESSNSSSNSSSEEESDYGEDEDEEEEGEDDSEDEDNDTMNMTEEGEVASVEEKASTNMKPFANQWQVKEEDEEVKNNQDFASEKDDDPKKVTTSNNNTPLAQLVKSVMIKSTPERTIIIPRNPLDNDESSLLQYNETNLFETDEISPIRTPHPPVHSFSFSSALLPSAKSMDDLRAAEQLELSLPPEQYISRIVSSDLDFLSLDDDLINPKKIASMGEVLEHVELLKEKEMRKQKRNIAKQERLLNSQNEYLRSKALEKIQMKKQKILSRRKACFQNHNTLTISEYEQDFFSKLKTYLDAPQISMASKANRLIDLLEDNFSRSWIYSRHLAMILTCFYQYGIYKQTKYFGTFRVEIAVLLFSRIVDIHNFDLVLEVLSPYEVACFLCRVGWLHIFNPCKPEGAWELDLSRREEHFMARILIALALSEPGENWINPGFQWSRNSEPVPGWALTEGWCTDEGLPTRGYLWLSYYSGEGKGKRGCKPNVPFRKSLLPMVLIQEKDIVNEENRLKPMRGVLPGEYHFRHNLNLWETFLTQKNNK